MTVEQYAVRFIVSETAEGRVSIHFHTLITERISAVVVLSPEDAAALAQQIVDTLQTRGTVTAVTEDKPS